MARFCRLKILPSLKAEHLEGYEHVHNVSTSIIVSLLSTTADSLQQIFITFYLHVGISGAKLTVLLKRYFFPASWKGKEYKSMKASASEDVILTCPFIVVSIWSSSAGSVLVKVNLHHSIKYIREPIAGYRFCWTKSIPIAVNINIF